MPSQEVWMYEGAGFWMSRLSVNTVSIHTAALQSRRDTSEHPTGFEYVVVVVQKWHRSFSGSFVFNCACVTQLVWAYDAIAETQRNECCDLIRIWCHLLVSNTAALITTRELVKNLSQCSGWKQEPTGGRFNRLFKRGEQIVNAYFFLCSRFAFNRIKTLWESIVFRF